MPFVLETILKWLIPFVCAGLISWITVKVVNPLKKQSEQEKIAEWEATARKTNIHHEIFDKYTDDLRHESQAMDTKIFEKLETLEKRWDLRMDQLGAQQLQNAKDLDAVRQGVLDAHLQNLISSCQVYIQRGYITPAELIQYNERLGIYKRLGGNGHMDAWDDRVKALPCHD